MIMHAPLLQEIHSLVVTTLKSDDTLKTAAAACRSLSRRKDAFAVEPEATLVVGNKGLHRHLVEERLREAGVCVEVPLIIGWDGRDQSGTATSADIHFSVEVRVNTSRIEQDGSARQDAYAICDAVTTALVRRHRHPGGEFFRQKKEAGTLVVNDSEAGLVVYLLMFSKERVL